jgi:hypothetical protein
MPTSNEKRGSGKPVRVWWAFLAVWMVASVSVFAQPAQIILLRHGEKPGDETDVHLSSRGERRARALGEKLNRPSTLLSNAPLAALYATKVTSHDHSHRTAETLAPLARATGLAVQTPCHSGEYAALARLVLADSSCQGKTVVICWVHHNLAQLAEALGVKPPPSPWNDKVFDRFWVITFSEGHASLRDLPQHLLKGDSKK